MREPSYTCGIIDQIIESAEDVRKANHELREYGNYWENRSYDLEKQIQELETIIEKLEES